MSWISKLLSKDDPVEFRTLQANKVIASVDGGPSGGSIIHRPGSEDPLQEEVKMQLARDMELGILEKMPYNEHTV